MSKLLSVTIDKLTVKDLKKIIREEVKSVIQEYESKHKDYYVTKDGIKVLYEEDEDISKELLNKLKKSESESTTSHKEVCRKFGVQPWK